ncbi:MAG: type 2 lanthipeptide synthetase LanM, partial [Thermoanaerobaculia bacterium]
SPDMLLREACRIGDRLVELALKGRSEDQEGATWLGMVLLKETLWRILPLGIDLYNGLGGIVLFLAYLAKTSGEEKYSTLARAALIMIRRQQRKIESSLSMTGAFTGWGGLIYVYTHLYALWKDPLLLEEALECARQAGIHAGTDENYEVMYGNAGAVLALNGLYEIHPSPDVLDSMQRGGRQILAQARPMERGTGWIPKALDCVPLAGFSHGASGIAAALEVLYRRTGDEEYLRNAASALEYERSLFSEEHGNWMDLRGHHVQSSEGDQPPLVNYPVAWCNGAPGVGLSRFRMPSLYDSALRNEVRVAIATTRSRGFGYTHSLCHGDLGNLEILVEARRAGWPLLEKGEVERRASGILQGIRREGWVCGTPRGIETPGLMTGLAGIGYGFLRLYDPEGTPSVLLLDPPVQPPVS